MEICTAQFIANFLIKTIFEFKRTYRIYIFTIPLLIVVSYFCIWIVKNASIDVLRHSQQSVHLDRWDCVSDENSDDLADECIHNADVHKLTELIDRLAPDDRRFVYLRYAEEMGYKEIGELLNISEDAAKKRGQRLVKKLRKLYEGG